MSDENFRIQAKRYFITYPRCTIGKAAAQEVIHGRYPGEIEFSVFVDEKHEDGSPHVHALVVFKKIKNIKSVRAFDIETFHPNVQAAKDLDAVLIYLRKEGRQRILVDLI